MTTLHDNLTYQDLDVLDACGYKDMPATLSLVQVKRLLLEHGGNDGDLMEFYSEFGDHATYSTETVNTWLGY